MANTESNCLTVDSVGKMTTYELRQEVGRRGLLGELQDVNHGTLMRRLVQVVVEDEHKRGQQSVYISADGARTEPGETTQERLCKERSARKTATIERSKQRQADQDYFRAKKMLNVRDERQEQEPLSQMVEDQDEEIVVSKINPRGHKVFVR